MVLYHASDIDSRALSVFPEWSSHVTHKHRDEFPTSATPCQLGTMNVFRRRIFSTPRVLARFSSTAAAVPPHAPTSTTPTFGTETVVSSLPQAPNHPGLWSEHQRPRPTPATGPRFEQTAMHLQPQPLSAMEMIAQEPIRLSETRIAACDGGTDCRLTPLPCRPASPARHLSGDPGFWPITNSFSALGRWRTARSP